MNSQNRGNLATRRHGLLAACLLAAGLCFAATSANANPLTISSVIGGAPTGTHYENFDGLALGTAGGLTPSGIVVSFNPDAEAVQGAVSGKYAAPFLSNSNGTLFGDTNNGADTTTYLTSGSTGAHSGAGVTLTFPGLEKYMGLLWGSVDSDNVLSFYNGATLIGTITGNDVTATASGDRGANGTFYVNINSTLAFDRIVATRSTYAFEFDNVAFNESVPNVPEPGIAGLFALGLLLVGSGYWLQRRKQTA